MPRWIFIVLAVPVAGILFVAAAHRSGLLKDIDLTPPPRIDGTLAKSDNEQASPPSLPPIITGRKPDILADALPDVKITRLVTEYALTTGDLLIKNHNAFPISDVAIECEVLAPSGTAIATFRLTAFLSIQPKTSAALKNYRFGVWPQQGKSMRCQSVWLKRL